LKRSRKRQGPFPPRTIRDTERGVASLFRWNNIKSENYLKVYSETSDDLDTWVLQSLEYIGLIA